VKQQREMSRTQFVRELENRGLRLVPRPWGGEGVQVRPDLVLCPIMLNNNGVRTRTPACRSARGKGLKISHGGVAGVLRAARPGAWAGRKRNLITNNWPASL
jgi:hypothetical protein